MRNHTYRPTLLAKKKSASKWPTKYLLSSYHIAIKPVSTINYPVNPSSPFSVFTTQHPGKTSHADVCNFYFSFCSAHFHATLLAASSSQFFACVVKSLPLQNANLPRALPVQKLLIDTVFFFLLLNCATILGMEWWRWHCAKSILEGNVTSSHLLDGMLWSGVSGLFISNSMSYST